MPAKPIRRLSKRNKEIIRRNYNKKLIQLNKLIYELSSNYSEISQQREFIQNFFNNQIDQSITIYRNQVKKLQNSSVDDYNFIVERTDRFYQRKYQKLQENYNFSDILIENSITEECCNLNQIVSDLNIQISNDQEKLENLIKEHQENLSEKIKEENLRGKQIIEDFLKDSDNNYFKYQSDFENRMKLLEKEHKMKIEEMQNEKHPLNIQIISSYEKVDFEQFQNTIKNLQSDHMNKLEEIKKLIDKEISDLKNKFSLYQEEFKELSEINKTEINNMNSVLEKLISQQSSKNDEMNSRIQLLQSEFDELKNEDREILDEKLKLLNQNDEKSVLDYLSKSLGAKFELFQEKTQKEEQKIKSIIDAITEEIQECNQKFINQSLELSNELNSQKGRFSQEIESNQKMFFSEKELILKFYQDELENLNKKMLLLIDNKDQAQSEHEALLNRLKNERDALISDGEKNISEIEKETEIQLTKLINDHSINEKNLQDEINSNLCNDEVFYENQIKETEQQNIETADNFRKEKEIEYENQINALRNSGYSKSEYEKLQKMYQDEYDSLLKQLSESNVIVHESEIFKNMSRVISDLKSELNDHENIIQSRARCINFEWQEKINKENERLSKSPYGGNSIVNPRARDQLRKSLQSKIEEVKKEKNKILSKLNTNLNTQMNASLNIVTIGFNETTNSKTENSNNISEIKRLQTMLSQLDKLKYASVQEAILKKEEDIQNLKDQIDQAQYVFGKEKRELLIKINDQKLDFNSAYKKLNSSLQSNQSNYDLDEKKELSSFQSKVNSLNFHFSEKKGSLLNEINDTKDGMETLPPSTTITQETRDAWTKQRIDFDSQIQCLRDQIYSEISKLNIQREEMSKNLDNIWKEKFDRKVKMTKIMSNWSPKSSENDVIAKLEGKLKAVSIQLTNSINELKKYKNLYMDQERQINM